MGSSASASGAAPGARSPRVASRPSDLDARPRVRRRSPRSARSSRSSGSSAIEGDRTLLERPAGSGAPWIVAPRRRRSCSLWPGSAPRPRRGSGARRRGTARDRRSRRSRACSSRAACSRCSSRVFFALYSTAPGRSTVSRLERSRSSTPRSRRSPGSGPEWLWQLVRDTYTVIVLTQPVVFAGAHRALALPARGVIWRRQQAGEAPWAFLDPGGQLGIPASRPRVARALAHRVRSPGSPASPRSSSSVLALRASIDARHARRVSLLAFSFVYWQLLIALLLPGGRGGRRDGTAAGARASDSWHGLAAAFTTGVIATIGIVVGPSLAGCVDPIAIEPGDRAPGTSTRDFSWFNFSGRSSRRARSSPSPAGSLVLGVQALLGRRHAPVPAPTA